jgi:MinD-like ATPase involved in chromosome partitioning or flagellar assembly
MLPSEIERETETQLAPRKRVILSMGGKGGVGKTNVMTGLAEWYQEQRIPVTLLDLDTENKARAELGLSKAVIRAEGYRHRLFEQFETVKDLLLP